MNGDANPPTNRLNIMNSPFSNARQQKAEICFSLSSLLELVFLDVVNVFVVVYITSVLTK